MKNSKKEKVTLAKLTNDNLVQEMQVAKGLIVPVKVPKNTHFVINDDDTRCVTARFLRFDGNWYAVSIDLYKKYSLLNSYKYTTLYECITKRGEVFLLPIHKSQQQTMAFIVENGKNYWIKITTRLDDGDEIYVHEKKAIKKQIVWPTESFEALIQAAFYGDFYLQLPDDPVFESLYGEGGIASGDTNYN